MGFVVVRWSGWGAVRGVRRKKGEVVGMAERRAVSW